MAKYVWPCLVAVAMVHLSFQAKPRATPLLVGAFLSILATTVQGALEKARQTGESLLQTAANKAKELVEAARLALRNDLMKPLERIADSIQFSLRAIRDAINDVANLVQKALRCTVASIREFLVQAEQMMGEIVGKIAFWTTDRPFFLAATVIASSSGNQRYLEVKRNNMVALKGVHLSNADANCSKFTLWSADAPAPVNLAPISFENRKIVLKVSGVAAPGYYFILAQLSKKGFWGCTAPVQASVPIVAWDGGFSKVEVTAQKQCAAEGVQERTEPPLNIPPGHSQSIHVSIISDMLCPGPTSVRVRWVRNGVGHALPFKRGSAPMGDTVPGLGTWEYDPVTRYFRAGAENEQCP